MTYKPKDPRWNQIADTKSPNASWYESLSLTTTYLFERDRQHIHRDDLKRFFYLSHVHPGFVWIHKIFV